MTDRSGRALTLVRILAFALSKGQINWTQFDLDPAMVDTSLAAICSIVAAFYRFRRRRARRGAN